MLTRCSLRAFQSQVRCGSGSHCKSVGNLRRIASTPKRNAPSPEPRSTTSRLRPWQRNFLVGLGAGIIFSQGYLYYNGDQTQKTSFVTYTLSSKQSVSSTASIFHLDPQDESYEFENYKRAWEKGIWNFHFKQPQIQVVRQYTPLPPLNDAVGDGRKSLRFLIRKDPQGEVSGYLHRLPLGSKIEMRGPNLEYELDPLTQRVIFFAGGTGIAPALQIAYAMFENHHDRTSPLPKLHILWASRHREDCAGGVSDRTAFEDNTPPKSSWFSYLNSKAPSATIPPTSSDQGILVKELGQLKQRYPDRITVEYFVNDENTWIDEATTARALSLLQPGQGPNSPMSRSQHVLISGPDGFINHLAGPKEWRNGREEQGRVGGVIAQALAKKPCDVTVWKI